MDIHPLSTQVGTLTIVYQASEPAGSEGTAGPPVADDEALTPAEKEAQAIVEHEETVAAEENAAEPEATDESTAEDAGIVDQQDAALEAMDTDG